MNNMTMDASRRRPLGITIIAVLVAIGGIFTIIISLLALFAVGTNALGVGLLVFAIILGIIDLVLAYGLWTLKKWAFWTTAVLEAISLASALIGIASGNRTSSQITSLVFAVVILIYLFADRNVRAAFRT